VEFSRLANEAGIKAIVGAELRVDGRRLNAYAANTVGYRHLCQLLSLDTVSPEALDDLRGGLMIAAPDSPDLALPEIRYAAERPS